ncbi:hypothetical protein [Aliamphritea spongicola]|uniref:hypothetical protein n=1 Tax=Aliamphritea spongicola TaxID=707589 RepID=UPI00196A3CAC|nr:hypothetical protein [Aliamphritea spongicola]MBN3563189.1 hypothetical protein [Aliamphritea spongicola]
MAVLACGAQIITYESKYKGLQVGKATIADVISLLGSPHGKKANINNVRYFFDGVHITIQDSTGRINTIIIYDRQYVDANGIRVGEYKQNVEYALNKRIRNRAVADLKNGITYWFENNRVSQIVLAYQAVDRNGKPSGDAEVEYL